MAAIKTITDVRLLVEVEKLDEKTGKSGTKKLSFSKIKTDATNDELLAAGKAIANLQTNTLEGVGVREDSKLAEGT